MPTFDRHLELVLTMLPTPSATDLDLVERDPVKRGTPSGFIALPRDRDYALDSPYVYETESPVVAGIPGAPDWASAQFELVGPRIHLPYWLWALSFYLGDARLPELAVSYEARFYLSVERLLRDGPYASRAANECIAKYRPYVERK